MSRTRTSDEHFKALKDKPFHGQFIREFVDGIDLKMWTTCINQHNYLIDMAIPGDSRVIDKITEKHRRYTDLKIKLQKM